MVPGKWGKNFILGAKGGDEKNLPVVGGGSLNGMSSETVGPKTCLKRRPDQGRELPVKLLGNSEGGDRGLDSGVTGR